MSLFRRSPGACPVCGAPHTSCTAGDKSAVTMVQLPARDRATSGSRSITVNQAPPSSDLVNAESVTPRARRSPTEFTTKTYDRKKHAPTKARR